MASDYRKVWPPTARPTGARGVADVYPQANVEVDVLGEVVEGTGVFKLAIKISYLSVIDYNYCFVPTGFAEADCTTNKGDADTGTLENGHNAHSHAMGGMLNDFFANQQSWIDGWESTERGIKIYSLYWRAEKQPEMLDGIMETIQEFEAIAYWDGTEAVLGEMPTGGADSLTATVRMDEKSASRDNMSFAMSAAKDDFEG